MKNPIKVVRYSAPAWVTLLLLMFFVGSTASKQQEERGRRREDVKLPEIISKVRSLEIVSTEVKGTNGTATDVEIKIRNNTDKPVIAIVVEVGDKKDASGITVNGFNEGDVPPKVVLEPYGTVSVDFPLGHLKHFKVGTPIRISAVMFADDTDEGEIESLKTMRGQRAHYKAKKPQ